MELIRNCSHHGSIHTLINKDENGKHVLKKTFEKAGVELLRSEFKGLCWYANRLNIDPIDTVQCLVFKAENDSYATLRMPFIKGELGKHDAPVKESYEKIRNAIRYHYDIFGGTGNTHGDYSLSNIIFDGDKVKWIIDWEHFTNGQPKYVDVLNLILEPYYFNCANSKPWYPLICNEDIITLNRLLGFAHALYMFPGYIRRGPVSYLSKFYKGQKTMFGEQVEKYPFYHLTCEQAMNLDVLLHNGIAP